MWKVWRSVRVLRRLRTPQTYIATAPRWFRAGHRLQFTRALHEPSSNPHSSKPFREVEEERDEFAVYDFVNDRVSYLETPAGDEVGNAGLQESEIGDNWVWRDQFVDSRYGNGGHMEASDSSAEPQSDSSVDTPPANRTLYDEVSDVYHRESVSRVSGDVAELEVLREHLRTLPRDQDEEAHALNKDAAHVGALWERVALNPNHAPKSSEELAAMEQTVLYQHEMNAMKAGMGLFGNVNLPRVGTPSVYLGQQGLPSFGEIRAKLAEIDNTLSWNEMSTDAFNALIAQSVVARDHSRAHRYYSFLTNRARRASAAQREAGVRAPRVNWNKVDLDNPYRPKLEPLEEPGLPQPPYNMTADVGPNAYTFMLMCELHCGRTNEYMTIRYFRLCCRFMVEEEQQRAYRHVLNEAPSVYEKARRGEDGVLPLEFAREPFDRYTRRLLNEAYSKIDLSRVPIDVWHRVLKIIGLNGEIEMLHPSVLRRRTEERELRRAQQHEDESLVVESLRTFADGSPPALEQGGLGRGVGGGAQKGPAGPVGDHPDFRVSDQERHFMHPDRLAHLERKYGPRVALPEEPQEMASIEKTKETHSFWALVNGDRSSGNDVSRVIDRKLSFFNEMCKYHEPGVVAYHICLDFFGRKGYTDAMVQMFDHMCGYEDGAGPGVGQRRQSEVPILQQECFEPVPRNVLIYHSMITAFTWTGDMDAALHYYQMMREEGIACNVFIYNALMSLFARFHDTRMMVSIFERMTGEGIPANVHVFSTLMMGFAKTGQSKQLVATFAEMIRQGIRPTVPVFNALMELYARDGQIDKMLTCLDEMENYELQPDRSILATVIMAAAMKQDLHAMHKLYNRVMNMNNRIRPTQTCFMQMAQAYAFEHRWDDMDRCWKALTTMHIPTLPSFGRMIGVIQRATKSDRASQNVDADGNFTAYTDDAPAVAYARWARGGHLEDSKDRSGLSRIMHLYDEMTQKWDHVPNSRILAHIFACISGMGDVGLMRYMRSEMKKYKMTPTMYTHTPMIRMLGRAGLMRDMVDVYSEMTTAGVKPDLRCLQAMAYSIGRMSKSDIRLEKFVLGEAKEYGIEAAPLRRLFSMKRRGGRGGQMGVVTGHTGALGAVESDSGAQQHRSPVESLDFAFFEKEQKQLDKQDADIFDQLQEDGWDSEDEWEFDGR